LRGRGCHININIMHLRKAMILAAGLGTRLYPLTRERPKALIEYEGKPLLQIITENLVKYGFKDIIVNIHHFPEMITDFLENNSNFGVNIVISDESNSLLETGGALKKASWFFDSGPFLVHNVDVITDLDLNEFYQYHLSEKNLATLAVTTRKTTRPLLINNSRKLCGWKNNITGEEIIVRQQPDLLEVGFSGIYILNPEIFNLMHETGKFSVLPVFLRLAKDHPVGTYQYLGQWKDMGKING